MPKLRLKRTIRGSVAMEPYLGDDGLWHIDNVPIISTGIEYPLASGPTTFTEEDITDAVAATADVAIVSPRVKLGHTSDYNAGLIGDAEQAFGRVEQLVLGDNNQTIYGNYIGTPEWLATVMPIAYPNRSIEGNFDVETVTGKKYKMVITAVVCLGVRWPGCQVLEDLPLWYGSEIPEGVEIDGAEDIAASTGGGVREPYSMSDFRAAVDVSLIRRKFYNDGPGADNYSYWIRGERFDSKEGFQLIVDMGDGELCRYPVKVKGSDITFGDYTLVTEEYPDKAVAATAVLAGMAIADRDMVVYASRADTEADRPIHTPEEGAQMDEATRQAFAARLDLPADATEEQIDAEFTRLRASAAEPAGDPPADPPTAGDPPADPPTDPPAGDDVEAGSNVVRIDRATYEHLKAGADSALANEEERNKTRVTELVASAITERKIPPARREHYETLATADFDGTKTLIDGLEPNAVPANVGVGASGSSEDGVQAGQGEGLPAPWFPEIAAIRAEAEKPRRVLQAREG